MFLGFAHLEALVELSRWSSETLGKQLTCLKGKSADEVRDDLALINDSFHIGDFNDIVDGALSFAVSCNVYLTFIYLCCIFICEDVIMLFHVMAVNHFFSMLSLCCFLMQH